ncbi:MAG: S1 RNA-binding domain-containing protein [Anaerolineae bacterium]|nr:S1 RNA-binding domain-containing protein [Anaerolineae bacterium]
MPEVEHTPPEALNAPEPVDEATPQPEVLSVEDEPLAEAAEVASVVDEAAAQPEPVPAEAELLAEAAEAVSAVDEHEPLEDEAEEAAEEGGEEPAIKRGTIVDGTVLETSPTEVLVDLGEDIVGVIASRELERMDREAIEALKPGSQVTAYVLKTRGSDGRPVLSLARAEEESNWRLAEKHYTSKEVYFSKIAGYNKGGLIVRFGKVRGFVPASQVSRERQQRATSGSPEERWGQMVGGDIAVKVVEIDRARNRLILSERAAAREWREKQKGRLLSTLREGEVRKGRVISVADFGAFVDLGGADGLVHLTELSWKHITHPREILEVGQEVEVEIISIDPQRKRIGLSMKRLERDPWQEIVAGYSIGQLVQATVTKLTKFGAFARLVDKPEIEGLIHISELADYRVSHPREVVLVGDVLTLRIVKIDASERRLGLSLRQVDSAKYMDQDWQAITGEIGEEAPAEPQPDADEPALESSSEDDGGSEAESAPEAD